MLRLQAVHAGEGQQGGSGRHQAYLPSVPRQLVPARSGLPPFSPVPPRLICPAPPRPRPAPARSENGSLVCHETGQVTAYAVESVQQRGRLFVIPGEQVYEGQVVGIHQRSGDLKVGGSVGRAGPFL